MSTAFYLDSSSIDFEGTRRLCAVILARRRASLGHAVVDVWSELEVFPPDADAARESLRELGEQQHGARLARSRLKRWRRKGPSFMGIDLDLSRQDHFDMLKAFGPYSIHAEAYLDDGQWLITMHDSGSSVTFQWDAGSIGELASVARVPAGALVILPKGQQVPQSRKRSPDG